MVIVCFELKSEEFDLVGLQSAIIQIAGEENALKIFKDVWLIDTTLSARYVYHQLHEFIHNGDRIFVTTMEQGDRQGWFSTSAWQWIRRHESSESESPSDDS